MILLLQLILIISLLGTGSLAKWQLELSRSPSLFETDRQVAQQLVDILGMHKNYRVQYWHNETKIDITNYLDELFYVTVKIGTPSRAFKMMIDTSTQNIWLGSTACNNVPLTCICATHEVYDGNLSTTYIPDGRAFLRHYGNDGLIYGTYSRDNFHLGEWLVQKQLFVDGIFDGSHFKHIKWDGILGLGLEPNVSSETEHKTLFRSLFHQYQSNTPPFENLFTLVFFNGSAGFPPNGILTFGTIDRSYIKGRGIVYLNAKQNVEDWEVQFSRMTMQNTVACINCNVIINTGYKYIRGPNRVINVINMMLRAKRFGNLNIIDEYEMHDFPDLVVNIRDVRNFTLKVTDYTLKIYDDHKVVHISAFVADDEQKNTNTWTMGMAFVKNFYMVFHLTNNTVGLASPIENLP